MPQPDPLDRAPTADDLIHGFKQGDTGNCASIAIIKAALMAFGTVPVFSSVLSDGMGDVVIMRDGPTEYFVSSSELEAAGPLSRFVGVDSPLLRHAYHMFAAMAKRAQMESNDQRNEMSFAQAAETLNDGEYWLEGPRWLGLESLVIRGPNPRIPLWPGPRDFLRRHKAGIGKSWGHTWFVSHGVHDLWGNARSGRWTLSGAIALDDAKVRR